ncbi:MAG: GldG family protein [Oscillospiraceae bacterium]|nr:GldG family protein [Oscillospiraceae bacterium]
MNFFRSRKFKNGAYGAVITAIVLALVVAVNVVAVLLTERSGAYIDLTAEKAFEVSDEVMEAFESIEDPVRVTVLYDEYNYATINPYCAQVQFILQQASLANPNITVRYIDPVQNPEIQGSYAQLDCTQGDMILENMSTGRAFELPFPDLFYFNSNSTGITGSKAEAVIAARMVSLTSGETFTVSFTTGHGEKELAVLREQLKLNNYTITDVATTTNEIPADTLCLVIAAPTVDFSEEEIRDLEEFLRNDGKYDRSILYFGSIEQPALTNLEGLLANYGFRIGNEIVAETNANYVYGGQASYALIGYLEDQYSAGSYNLGLACISPYTRPLNILFSESANVRVAPLFSFSPSSIAIDPLNSSNYISGSEQELYGAAVAEIYEYVSGEGERVSRFMVMSSIFFADDTMLSTESLGNANYLVSTFGKLAPNEISIDVASKSILGGYMSITAGAAKWLGIVFVGLLPAAVIAMGVWVFIRRRNR